MGPLRICRCLSFGALTSAEPCDAFAQTNAHAHLLQRPRLMETTVLTVAISLRCTVQHRQDPDHKKRGNEVLEFADRFGQTDAVGRV